MRPRSLSLFLLVGCLASAPLAQLPAQVKAPSSAPSNRIVLTLTEAQLPSINGQSIAWDDLERELRAIYTRRPGRVLFLRAHPRNDYRTVARVTELARRHGITVNFLPYS